jgi:hypothetical protein
MRTNYNNLRESREPPELSDANKELVGSNLWDNFNQDLRKKPSLPNELMKSCLARMIFDQGGDFNEAPAQLLSYMTPSEIYYSSTQLYTWLQLGKMMEEAYKGNDYSQVISNSPYFDKAFKQANPYILRYHVLALHNQMHEKIASTQDATSRNRLYAETLKIIPFIENLAPKHPGFAHFLLGYSHYTLAMGATPENAKAHWVEAYKQFLWAEQTEKKYPRASFIVNLGQGLYKDMPFDNLEIVKKQIEDKLDTETLRNIRSGLSALRF